MGSLTCAEISADSSGQLLSGLLTDIAQLFIFEGNHIPAVSLQITAGMKAVAVEEIP